MAGLMRRAIRKYLLEHLDRAEVQSNLEGNLMVGVAKVGFISLDAFILHLMLLVKQVDTTGTFQLLSKAEGAQSYLVRFTTSNLNTAFKGVQSTATHMDRLNARIKAAEEQGIITVPLAALPSEDLQRAEVQAPAMAPVASAEAVAEVPDLARTPAEMLAQAKARKAAKAKARKAAKAASKRGSK